jgi:hypothetical protein
MKNTKEEIHLKQITRRSLALLLTLAMLCGLLCTTAFAAEGTWSGQGTQAEPYLIEDADDLAALATAVNDNHNMQTGTWFKVTNDITVSDWVPIGTNKNYPFKGYFDGDGHTITINNIASSAQSGTYVGLFGYLMGYFVANVTVDGTINATNSSTAYVGGIAGYLDAGTASYEYNRTIVNCVNNAAISISGSQYYNYAGGIVGYIAQTKNCVNNCLNTGTVSSAGYAGGIYGCAYNGYIQYCYTNATVSGRDGYFGEVFGKSWATDVSTTYCATTWSGVTNKDAWVTAANALTTTAGTAQLTSTDFWSLVDNAPAHVTCAHTNHGEVTTTPATCTTAGSESFHCNDCGEDVVTTIPALEHSFTSYSVVQAATCTVAGSESATCDREGCDAIDTREIAATGHDWDWDNATENGDYRTAACKNGCGQTKTKNVGCDEWDGTAEIWTSGAGTETNPYLIESAANLAYLAKVVNDGASRGGIQLQNCKDVYFQLEVDLDLRKNTWVPIGTSSSQFCGTFDGNGHTINLNLSDDSAYRQGLFGVVGGTNESVKATIKNLIVQGTVNGSCYVGGVAGYANYADFENVGSEATVGNSTGCTGVGGIVGYANNTVSLTNCYNKGTVNGTGTSFSNGIGGLVGYAGSTITFTNCYNLGAVTGKGSVGGLIGSGNSSTIFDNCYNGINATVTMAGSTSYYGSIGGYVRTPSGTAYYNTSASSKVMYYTLSGAATYETYTELLQHLGESFKSGESVNADFDSAPALAWEKGGGTFGSTPDPEYTVTFSGDHATVTVDDEAKTSVTVAENGSVSFKVAADEGYDLTSVQVGGEALTAEADVYTLSDITGDTTITITTAASAVTKVGDVYQIGDAAALTAFAAKVADGEYSANAKLTANITLTADWDPVGTLENPYTGTFDGDGHTISGLHINSDAAYAGLFGVINGATIKNLIVQGYVRSTAATGSVGAVAAFAKGSNTFTNVGNEAIVISDNTNAGYYGAGGILGFVDTNSSAVFTGCYNKGEVQGKAGYTAGIVGGSNSYCTNTDAGINASITLTNCYNLGKISKAGLGGGAGGIIGYSYDAVLTNCYNKGSVQSGFGELAGNKTGDAVGKNCYTSTNEISVAKLGNGYKTLNGNIVLSWETEDYVAPVHLVSIAVTTPPTKTAYTTTESFSTDGMVVTATYSDNSTKAVTGYTVTPSGTLKATNTSVTISYNDYTTVVNDVTATTAITVTQTVYTVTFNCAEGVYVTVVSGPIGGAGENYELVKDETDKITGVKVYDGSPLYFNTSANDGYTVDSVTGAVAQTEKVSYQIESVTSNTTVTVTAKVSDTYFAGEGSGTEASPYLIQTEADLRALAAKVNSGVTYYGVYFKLMRDIELTGAWTPIGTGSYLGNNTFKGTFDGNGHTVSGLSIHMTDAADSGGYGLFGVVTGATIQNLAVKGSITNTSGTTSGAKSYFGGIVGVANGVTLIHCASHVDVSNVFEWYTGASGGSSSAPESYVGGLVGYICGEAHITGCYADGDVKNWNNRDTYANNSKTYVGGLVGGFFHYGDNEASTLTKSFAYGQVVCNKLNDSSVSQWDDALIGYNGNDYGSITIADTYYLSGIANRAAGGTALGATAFLSLATTLGTPFTAGVSGHPVFTWETETESEVPTVTADTAWYNDDATEFTLTTQAQLLGFAKLVNEGNSFSGKTVTLGADITVTGTWTAIGTNEGASKPFSGVFNGGYHSVMLDVQNAATAAYNGLFGYISGATVEEVIVEGSITGGNYTAGIVARALDSVISNCGNKAAVSGSGYVGGVLAYGNGTQIMACYNTGAVTNSGTASLYSTGGIAGWLGTSLSVGSGSVAYSYNTGAVTGHGDSYSYTGGIAGNVQTTGIIGSYSIGTVSGEGSYVGGILGSGNLYYQQSGYNYYLASAATVGAGTGADSADYISSAADLTALKAAVSSNYYTDGALYWEADHGATVTYITQIRTVSDLREFANNVKAGHSYYGETVTLANDVDLGGVLSVSNGAVSGSNIWTAIGDVNNTVFAGTFDGNGHTIGGMVIINFVSGGLGLFSALPAGATVQDLTVSGQIITGGDSSESSCIGSIVGWNQGTVTRCVSNVDIQAYSYYAVGGIVGDNAGTVTYCVNNGTVDGGSTSNRVGGIAGRMEPSYGTVNYKTVATTHPVLTNCINTGNVTGYEYVGGIVGGVWNESDGDYYIPDIANCYNAGAVTGSYRDSYGNTYTGVIAGNTVTGVVDCYYKLDAAKIPDMGDISGENYVRPVSEEYANSIDFAKDLGLTYDDGFKPAAQEG